MGKKPYFSQRNNFLFLYVVLALTHVASPFASFNSVVEFKDEEFVKKAVLTMNKHDLSGRPLNIKEVRSIDCRLYLAVLFF